MDHADLNQIHSDPSRDLGQAAPSPTYARLAVAGLVCVALAALAWGLLAEQIPAMILSLLLTTVAARGILRWGARPHVVVLMLALAAMSLFRLYYVVSGPFDLSGDEAQYWDWSRHMDWSYVTKGPGVAAFIWLGRQVFGETALAVRGPAVVLGFFSSLLLFRLGARVADEKAGAIAAGLFQIVPIYALFSVGMNTDPPLIFFWLASLLALHQAMATTARWPWLLIGLTVGLGFLSKYTMAMFFISTLLYLLTRPEGRRHLRTPWPYVAVLLSVAVMSPVFYWNAQHGGANFRHNMGHVVGVGVNTVSGELLRQYIWRLMVHAVTSCMEFIGGQLGAVSPLLLVFLILAAIRRRKIDGLSFWFSVPLFALFVLKSLLSEVLPNWALAAYLTGLIAFAAYYLRDLARFNKHIRRLVVAAVIVAVVGSSLVYYPMAPMALWRSCAISLGGALGIDPHQLGAAANPMKKIRGWADLAAEVDLIRPQVRKPYFICSDRYPIASCLAFYLQGHPRTYCVYQKRPPGQKGKGRLERRMNQFDIWEKEAHDAGQQTYGDFVGQDAIFVTDKPEENKDLPSQLQAVFASWEKLPVVKSKDEFGYDYLIFICHDFKGMKVELPENY
jgi:undecaprenyl-diphosphatase